MDNLYIKLPYVMPLNYVLPPTNTLSKNTWLASVHPPLGTVLVNLLPQRVPLPQRSLHDALGRPAQPFRALGALVHVHHLLQHGLQLVRQPRHDGTAARRRRVRRALEDVLAREAPVPPAEVAHLVEDLHPERPRLAQQLPLFLAGGRRLRNTIAAERERVPLQVHLERALLDVHQEGPVVAGPVLPEVAQDLGQRRVGHGHLQQVVHERHHAVVGAGLAAERERLAAVVQPLVHDAVGEHGLRRDAEDEGPEARVLGRARLGPHGLHDAVDLAQRAEDRVQTRVERAPALRRAAAEAGCGVTRGTERVHGAGDERARVADHVDVHQDEAGLGRRRVEAVLEGADETQVGVVHAALGVLEAVVEESIRPRVLHEGLEATAVELVHIRQCLSPLYGDA